MSSSSLRAMRNPSLMREAVIHMGIVDEPFPADGGARFFKIDPHDDLELALQRLAQGQQAGGILFRRCPDRE